MSATKNWITRPTMTVLLTRGWFGNFFVERGLHDTGPRTGWGGYEGLAGALRQITGMPIDDSDLWHAIHGPASEKEGGA